MGLILHPIRKAASVELMTTVDLRYLRSVMKLLQTEAAVIAFCIAKWTFVAFEREYSDLPQSFEPDLKCKPAKRIGRFDPAVKIPIIDKNVIDDILENVEEYDGDK